VVAVGLSLLDRGTSLGVQEHVHLFAPAYVIASTDGISVPLAVACATHTAYLE
jgi:hypothetical protein